MESNHKIAVIKGKKIGQVIHQIPLYFIELEDGEIYPYAELGDWIIFDVRDLELHHKEGAIKIVRE